jgi:CelD/BcsL family acetyltransferase involved in cellulose biosynthesis
MLNIVEVRTIEKFRSLKEDWNKLLSKSAFDTVFLTWEWLYTWWEKYSSRNQLHIVIFRENSKHVIGIAPFYISYEKTLGIPIRLLKLIGSEEVCSEYLDIITHKDRTDEVIKTMVSYLQEKLVDWDILYFNDVNENSKLNEVLKQLRKGDNVIYQDRIHTTNPFITLPEREDVFFASLNHNKRSAIKRKEKKLAREHGFSFISTNEGTEKAFHTFVTLHQKLWKSRGLPGMFKRKNFLQFHETVAKRFAENDWLHLYFLSVNGKPVASLYGFQYRDKFYYYQSGFDPDWKVFGVGKILLKHTIQEAIRNKLKEYDFLRGEADYKFDFTQTFRHTRKILVARDTRKANFYLFAREMHKRSKNVLKGLLPERLVTLVRKIRDHIVLR